MLTEPPFPFCPCWICLGDFDCCAVMCGQQVPDALMTMLTHHPTVWLTEGRAQAIRAIRRYQTEISAHRPAICHFTPSCSHYGVGALERFGLLRGGWLILRRLARCRASVPWGTPDPVPSA
ncbi:membrane protein insertion efficiency factor YidD [Hamadaea tsunoensis]|uniref:membrane protein insertion efficiency factor YidD n=1 Tax=Hamadaea tsunoensis TaxID=53368 RepID=UPI00042820BC|nr:membrane protein insertion efficiency factor YidD [Hamadaea tsunoensis]